MGIHQLFEAVSDFSLGDPHGANLDDFIGLGGVILHPAGPFKVKRHEGAMDRGEVFAMLPAGELLLATLFALPEKGAQIIVGRDGIGFVFDRRVDSRTLLERQGDAEKVHIFSVVVVKADAELAVPPVIIDETAIRKGMEIAVMFLALVDAIGEVDGEREALHFLQLTDRWLIGLIELLESGKELLRYGFLAAPLKKYGGGLDGLDGLFPQGVLLFFLYGFQLFGQRTADDISNKQYIHSFMGRTGRNVCPYLCIIAENRSSGKRDAGMGT